MRRLVMYVAIVCIGVVALLVAATASAQERGSIVGVVQDSSGAVLPGVTVEVASPALIEQTRSGLTDSSGRYAIIDLRPGTYSVTISLAGFQSFKREGIVLEGAFAATVNGTLQVGGIQESLTVSGASPVVDLQSTQNQSVINRTEMDQLPASRTMQGGASLVPGVSYYSQGFTSTMSIHGSVLQDQHIYFDGMNIGQNLTQGGFQGNGVSVNELAQTELIYDAGSQSAENPLGGVRMDSIPKEGGNTFSGTVRAFGSNGSMQNKNITPALQQYITAGNSLDYLYDVNGVLGGPIRRNKLWFFAAQRVSQTDNLIPLPTGLFPLYPQGGTAKSGGQVAPNSQILLTYQASPRNKIAFAFYKSQGGTQRFDVGCSATSFNAVSCISPEASYWLPTPLQYAARAKWSSPITSRLLLEIGESLAVPTYDFKYQPGTGPLDIQHYNATENVRTVASATAPAAYFDRIFNTIANISYVTGSHNVKVGVNFESGYQTTLVNRNGDTSLLTYVNNAAGLAVPNSVTLTNSPLDHRENLNAQLGLFAQDKWTTRRLTVTYGGRYDYFNASTPAESAAGGRFMSAAAQAARQNIAAVPCLPCWKDWAIRTGASYDLFGNGKTAIKVSVGKFLSQQALGLASSTNPLASQSDTRSWNDLDNNGSIFDANGNVQFAEIGPSRNSNFGLPVGGTVIDPNLPRPYNWEESVSVQHELLRNVSVTGGFYHRAFYNLEYTKNTDLTPADYTPFTVVVPANANLPGGGGQTITMYNLNANKLGQVANVLTWSTQDTQVYNGFELSTNARLPHGGFLFGGITFERTATNDCADLGPSAISGAQTAPSPNNLRFCNEVPPFRGIYKAASGYVLPYDVNLSVTAQWRPGISVGSYYVFTSTTPGVSGLPAGGLTGGGSLTTTVVDPAARFYPYVKTLDVQISRTFKYGRTHIQPFVEIFSLPNFSTILTVNENVGPNYFNPGTIAQARRFQFGGRVDF